MDGRALPAAVARALTVSPCTRTSTFSSSMPTLHAHHYIVKLAESGDRDPAMLIRR